jgi:hypothetical protein
LKPTPCVTLVGLLFARWVTAPGLTAIPFSAPTILLVSVSVAWRNCVPARFSVAVKVWTPASAAVKV